ncbi:MAG: phosphogluconate dehydrogenase (NAD(+)-dependent, decarboxylating) [Minisyncoccales bacterium]
MKKEIAIIGLGKMGKNMSLRLREKGWKVFGFDINLKLKGEVSKRGIKVFNSLEELVKNLSRPRLIWLMVPAGKPVEDTLFGKTGLINFLEKRDIVIDGGNSFFEDSILRAKKLAKKKIEFLDVGVSGGPEGARKGACLMIGGKRKLFEKLKPLFEDLATKNGFQFFEGIGSGHFVKMVHNGIEYGMMQAIAEGFNLMKNSPFKLDLKRIADVYNHGSVIQSRLIEWLKKAFERRGQDLKIISGKVRASGEGEWTVKTAKKWKIPVKIIEESYKFRVKSQKNPSYTGKILSALREQFGGHKVTK